MNQNKDLLEQWSQIDCDTVDFDELENKLESELEEQMADLTDLEKDREIIGNPDSLGDTVMNVVWEQFVNQIGVVAGEDFIKENRELKLDLRDSAHIQTAENFEKGNIAEHNYISKDQLKHNYDRYKNTPHGEFRDKYVDPGMNATLQRAGRLHDKGVETVTDIYTGRQIPTKTKLDDGSNNPKAAQREHVDPSEKVYSNPSLQMANNNEELASIINNPENLQGYTTAERNQRKSNYSAEDMEDRDKNKHWEKANKRAEEHIKKKEQEGEDRLKAEGKQTQKEEAMRIGGKALRSIIMGMLASLIKDIIRKLVSWFRSGNRKLNTFINSVKEAIHSFISNIKQHLLTAGNTLVTTISTAIVGPIIGTIKKAWIFLKQGYKSLKEAISFMKDPANKNMPFSVKLMQVGKIVIVGLTAGGAIVLSEVIEKGLMTIPGFAFEIPLLGSLANIIGIFLGAVVSGIIGALALNLIDKTIASRMKKENDRLQLEKKNSIIQTQEQLIEVTGAQVTNTKVKVATNIAKRHVEASKSFNQTVSIIQQNVKEADILHDSTSSTNDDISKTLGQL